MELVLTPVGAAVLVLAAVALVGKRNYLLPLLIVASVLQAPAVFVVQLSANSTGIGISPWLVVCGVCMSHVVFGGFKVRHQFFSGSTSASMAPWVLFIALSIVTALVSPFVYSSALVFELGNRLGFDTSPVPLHWSTMNAIQAVNSAVVLFALLYAWLSAHDYNVRRWLVVGIVSAIVVSVVLCIYQRLQWVGVTPSLGWFSDSYNPTYVQREGRYFTVPRLHWPFTEPSYASVWFASTYVGGLAIMLLTRRVWTGFVCVVACGAALVNTVGGSGSVVAGVMTTLLVLVFFGRVVNGDSAARMLLRHRVVAIFGVVLLAFVGAVVISHVTDGRVTVESVYGRLVDQRVQWIESGGDTRSRSNVHALELIRQTWPIGVGLGSNRASSYLASLASNLGLPVTCVFLVALGLLFRRLYPLVFVSPLTTFVFFGMLAAFFGSVLAIPDINWPGWWVWPLMAIAISSGPRGQVFHRDQVTKGSRPRGQVFHRASRPRGQVFHRASPPPRMTRLTVE